MDKIMDSPVHPVGSIPSLTSMDEKNDNLKSETESKPKNETPINSHEPNNPITSQIPGTQSNLFRMLNKCFEDDLNNTSFKRLCTSPDTIPRFFSVPSKIPILSPKAETSTHPCMQDESSFVKQFPEHLPNTELETTATQLSKSLFIHSNTGMGETNTDKVDQKSSALSSCGFCGLLDGDDIQTIGIIRPTTSNTSLCSAMSADITLKSISKPKAESSNCSLKEIESFHQQFVGNLPLLNCPTLCCGEGASQNCLSNWTGQPEVKTEVDTDVICNQNHENTAAYESVQDNIIPPELNGVKMSSELTAPAPCCCCEMADDPENNVKAEELTALPVPSIPSEAPNAVDDMIKTISIKYLEFIETEWKARRGVWKANLKHAPEEQRKKSLYTHETFKECVASRKIRLQVPFGLPKVRENNGNLVLQDSDTPPSIKEPQVKKASKKNLKSQLKTSKNIKPEIESADETLLNNNDKNANKSSTLDAVNNAETSLSLHKLMSNIIKSDETLSASLSSIQDENLDAVDVSSFIEEYKDFWEHLKTCPTEPSEFALWASLLKEKEICQPKSNESDPVNNDAPVDTDCQNTCALDNVTATKKSKDKVTSPQNKIKASYKTKSKPESNPPKIPFGYKLTESKKSKQDLRTKSKDKPVKKVTIGRTQSKDPENVISNCTDAELDLDPHANEPLVEIYRGLSRENTLSKIKRETDKQEEYRAFVNGRVVVCDSIEQKTRLDICCMKLNSAENYPTNLKDLSILPGVKILPYLKLQDFMNCRLVCKNWNIAATTCQKFLSTTTFIVEQKPLGALAILEESKVRWQNLRCSIMPSINFTSQTYNGRFISSNLRVIPQANRREPLTNTLTTVIFENFNINKQQLVQWIQNCKRLSVIEIRNCNFLKSTISMNMDKTNRVMERIQKMKFADMNYVRLAEVLRFFLPATRRLHTLEIKQSRGDIGKSSTFSARKGAEEDISVVLCPTLTRNVKSLRNIVFELISTKNYQLQSRIVETLGKDCFQLSSLVIRSFSQDSSLPCVKMDSYGSSKCMTSQVRSTLQGSTHMSLLDFPMLVVDFIRNEDGSKLLPATLEKLAAQLELPNLETFKTRVDFPNLKELELYGPLLEDTQWGLVKQTMRGLTQLVVHCAGIRDSHLQSIINNLKSLQLLSLENVMDVTDFGVTGMEPSWIERLKMYWPEKIEASYDQFPRDKIRFIGKSLSTLEELQTFRMTGEFGISNVGVLYGFNSKKLTTLELVGSPVNVSNSGMFILGFQCSHLRLLHMTVKHAKANHFGVRDLYESIAVSNKEDFQVELLPSQDLSSENDSNVPMIDTY